MREMKIQNLKVYSSPLLRIRKTPRPLKSQGWKMLKQLQMMTEPDRDNRMDQDLRLL